MRSSRKCKGQKAGPTEYYDETISPHMFHMSITEGTEYVRDSKGHAKKYVFILLHYLTGRAHEFYLREVAGNPYRWGLPKFFGTLFDYCFAVAFCAKQ